MSERVNRKSKAPAVNKNIIIVLSVVVVVVLCIVAAVVLYYDMLHGSVFETPVATRSQDIKTIELSPNPSNLNPHNSNTPDEETKMDIYNPPDDIEFILLFGLADYNLADTIWIGIVNRTKSTLDFLSIPRDTYLRYYDRNFPDLWKINSYYNSYVNDEWVRKDDAESSMHLLGACEILLNIDMDNYIRVSYDSIEKIVDAMGGIEYNVPFDMKYTDPTEGYELNIDIEEGYQVLSGEDTVKFLRFRQGEGYEGISDIGRISRQQSMVKAIIKKALSLSYLSTVIDIATENIRTNLPKDKMSSFISFSLSLNADTIKFHTLKGYEETIKTGVIDNQGNEIARSFYITNPKSVREQLILICE